MPNYPIFDVNLLLETLAKKAGIPVLDKGGFDAISRQLRAKGNPYGVKISARYLKERIYQRLKMAVDGDEAFIDLNQAYIDSISFFLGFNSFTAFQKTKNKLREWLSDSELQNTENPKVLVVHDSENKHQMEELKQLTNQLEEPASWVKAEGLSNIHTQVEGKALVIYALSDLKDLESIDSLLENDPRIDFPTVFLFNQGNNPILEKSLPVKWQDRPMLDLAGLAIALSLLETDLEDKTDNSKESPEEPKGFDLKKSGAIIGGKHKIKGKYQNVGSMHITINKHKS